jgi:hypothetical protein
MSYANQVKTDRRYDTGRRTATGRTKDGGSYVI